MKDIANPIPNKRTAWCALLLIIVLTGVIRYRLIDVPFERDEGEYAYAGQLILQGIPPYQEICNMKLPGVYAAYALLLAIFGQSYQGIHTALLIINALTIILVFLLTKHVTNRLCAVISAAAFALLSMSQAIQGVFANAEHFVIFFALGGLLFLLQGLATKSMLKLFFAGLLLGLSFVMKQHGIVFSALAVLYIIFDWLRQRPIPWRRPALQLLSFSGGVASIFGGLCLIMIWTGVFTAFWFWTVKYASTYISQVPLEQAWWAFKATFTKIVRPAPLLWILVGFGFFALFTKKTATFHRTFLLLLFMFSVSSICPGFYFRPHYFILLLPCAGLLAGVAISVISDFLAQFVSKKIQYGVPVFLILICFGQFIYNQQDFMFHMTPFQVSRSTYGLNPFPESLKIAGFIREHTNPTDRIAILGSEPQIFFYSQRRSASSYVYMYPLMENHEFALQMQKNFIKDIEIKKPKYIVFVNVRTSWLQRPDSHRKIFKWFNDYLNKKYLKLVGTIELFNDRTVYHWESEVKWPVRSKSWIAVFERAT